MFCYIHCIDTTFFLTVSIVNQFIKGKSTSITELLYNYNRQPTLKGKSTSLKVLLNSNDRHQTHKMKINVFNSNSKTTTIVNQLKKGKSTSLAFGTLKQLQYRQPTQKRKINIFDSTPKQLQSSTNS